MSDSVQPQRRQSTRLPRPWDSPGKNTGVGCHFFLQCMKVKRESEVAQSCPTPSDAMDCSLPGSSAHGIFQARVLEWGTIAFSGNSNHIVTNSIKNLKKIHLKIIFKKSHNSVMEQCCIFFFPWYFQIFLIAINKKLVEKILEIM